MRFEKLSQEKIQRIRELAGEGLTKKEIAEQVGVSGGSVTKYIQTATREVNPTDLREVLARLTDIISLLSERMGAEDLSSRFDLCPTCQHILYLHREDGIAHLACYKCGWWAEVEEPTWQKEGAKYKIK